MVFLIHFRGSSVTLKNSPNVVKAFQKHARFSLIRENLWQESMFNALTNRQIHDTLILWNGVVKAFLSG